MSSKENPYFYVLLCVLNSTCLFSHWTILHCHHLHNYCLDPVHFTTNIKLTSHWSLIFQDGRQYRKWVIQREKARWRRVNYGTPVRTGFSCLTDCSSIQGAGCEGANVIFVWNCALPPSLRALAPPASPLPTPQPGLEVAMKMVGFISEFNNFEKII